MPLQLQFHSSVRLWRDRADWDKLIVTMLSSPMITLDVDLLEQELTKVCVCVRVYVLFDPPPNPNPYIPLVAYTFFQIPTTIL